MANPIKKDELVTDEALGQLKLMADRLTIIAENLTKAKEACQSWGEEEKKNSATTSNNVEELSKMAARITQLEDAIKKLNAAEKENENARRSVNEQKRLYRKLTDDEIKSVEDLKRALQGSVDEQMKAVNAIEVEKKSYNELNQVYNALKDTLNKMTTAERENTDAGKAMTAQASKVYETMNQLQQATGKYTLQVGKYRAAFDGLGYSFQQILREAPSALNLNQFFLAISNNIPMFLDQLKAFNEEQKAIKANLDQMTEGTKEYAEQLSKVESVGKKLGRTLVSWQSLVLVGLMLLRNLPRISDWISKIGKGFSSLQGFIQKTIDGLRVLTDAFRSMSVVNAELDYIKNRLNDINTSTDEWIAAVKEVNRLTNANLDPLNTTKAKLEEIIDTYKKLQYQMNVNNEVFKKIAEDDVRRVERNALVSIGSLGGVREYLGEGSLKDVNENKMDYLLQSVASYQKQIDEAEKRLQKGRLTKEELEAKGKQLQALSMVPMTLAEAISEIEDKDRKEIEKLPSVIRQLYRQQQAKIDEVNKEAGSIIIQSVMSEDRRKALWDMVKLQNNPFENGNGNSTTAEQEMNNQFWKAAEARRNIMLVGYQKELADEKAAHLQQMQEQKRANKKMQDAVEENVKNGYLSRAAGDLKIQELQKQNDDIMEGLILEHHKKVNAINTKYAEMDRQVVVEEELGWIEELDEAYKVDENVRRRRIKTIKDEEQSNLRITNSILKMREEIEKLQEKNLTQPEAIEQRTKRIQELEKAIAQLQTQIDHTKQLSNYSSVGDIFRRNVSIGAGTQQSLMESILGKDAYSAFAPGSKEMQDAIEKDFDTWMQSVEQSVSTWYSTTMGYINDLISAYVELANAKAEAAAEATEAAQEEYDKEKALLEAGYASRVEATWAEYQEKKAAQEKAEEDAKAAAKAQQQLNEAEAMGSLIVASANIWKTFSKIPTVGVPLALAALATMWGSFIQAKVKAAEVSKYGEGGFEVLEGGSHASGHDIDLGVRNRRGRRMRAEGKEGLGIFRIRAMNHYGADNIEGWVNSINRLEFEGNAAKRMSLERNVGLQVLSMPRTDLHKLESSVDKLVGYGSRNVTVLPDGTVVETRKNARITYRQMR